MERLGLTPITDYTQIVLQPSTVPVQPLQPLQPGQVPVVYDPVATGYANLNFANAQQTYIDQKTAALNEARQAQEAAAASVIRAAAAQNNLKAAAVGAGAIMLAVKFLL